MNGHCKIYSSEQADALVKSTVQLEETWEGPSDLQLCISLGKTSIHLLLQNQWTDLTLITIKPTLGKWGTANRPTPREEIVLSRVRMNCTQLTHLTPYLSWAFPPNYQTCNTLSIILHCRRFTRERSTLVNYWRETILFTLVQFFVMGILRWLTYGFLLKTDPLDRRDVTDFIIICTCLYFLFFMYIIKIKM